MSDIDSAFVEIAAREPEIADAAERLLPLYEDPAEVPASGSACDSHLRKISWITFVAVALVAIIAGGFLMLLFAVWLGQHGMLAAPGTP